ncbi:transcription antitermination factor NusB [Hyphobacterium sp.]|uniref:transcription antitermination factor NusB n=1 Tax=Hyphobacterium sp. TaxID=2004662 RepID=UPI003748E565
MDISEETLPAMKPKVEARLSAVQALFQIDQGGGSVERVLGQFAEHRLSETADAELFEKLVRGTIGSTALLDQKIAPALTAKWKLERIDATLRAILRCGVFEMIDATETPAPVLLEAYVDIAAAFFDDKDVAFVNAVLDRLTRDIRPGSLVG